MTQLTKEITDLFGKLVSFDTTSRNSNLKLIEYAANYLKDTGARVHFDYNTDKSKANLVASVGPNVKGGLLLSGHTDTVPVDGQNWSTDPFTLVKKDGRFYGRGTADMKGFCATAIAQVAGLTPHANRLKIPVHVALTYDEEVGCVGAAHLLKKLDGEVQTPDLVIVGEPTKLVPVNGHKGIRCFNTHVRGRACHSSDPKQGASAIKTAAHLISGLYETAAQLEHDRGKHDRRFQPPYTTLNVGTISGGNAVNIVADCCEFKFEIRPLPGETGNEILERQKALLPIKPSASEWTPVETTEWVSVPAFSGDRLSAGSRWLTDLYPKLGASTAPFTTEAGLYQREGWNTLVWGPGDIAQAHKADEYIKISQLTQCRKVLGQLTRHCLKP